MEPIRTLRAEDSTPTFVRYPTPPDGAPNIVVVVLDDVGFAQLGCFGGAIATPNIDRLAAEGARYNRFHVTAVCSSTRACVLTGRNHHAVGIGLTQESVVGFPGYTGRLPRSAATVARTLRDAGYNTMAIGKWHLAANGEYSAAGPFEHWPLGLGFEHYYGFLGAETSQWAPELVRDNSHIDPPRTPEEGYHLSEDLADAAIAMVTDQQQAAPGKPFFAYLAPGAAHSPHQVHESWVAPYRGRFDGGWEQFRDGAFERQVAEGIVPPDTTNTERPSWVPEWSSLSADEQRLFARYMEVFAGFLTHADAQLGRFFDHLESRGILDDTLVMVLSDNGASAEGGIGGAPNVAATLLGGGGDTAADLERIDEIGGHRAFNHYPYGWAWAGNAPLRLWKRYAWLGGVRTPLVVRWPGRITEPGSVRGQFCHAVDVFSTVLDAAGVEPPAAVDGVDQQPIDGTSLLPTFADAGADELRPTQYFEMMGSRGLYHRGWKVTTDYVSALFDERSHIEGSHDFDDDHWALFDLSADFSESSDLSAERPEKVRELQQLWWSEAGRNNVLPLWQFPDSMSNAHPPPRPRPSRVLLGIEGGPITETQLPAMLGGFSVTAEVEVPDGGASGVLCALGDRHNGWAFYLHDGRPTAVFEILSGRGRVNAPDQLAPGTHHLELRYDPSDGGRTSLHVDGDEVASSPLPGIMMFTALIPSGGGLLVGRDRGIAMSDDYSPPFAFTGTIRRMVMASTAPDAADPAAEAEVAARTD